MGIGWDFPLNNNGVINGIGQAGIETFKGNLFPSLAREICQNSLDARLDETKPVKVEFKLSNITRENILGIDDLTTSISLCKDYWRKNPKTFDFFSQALKICQDNRIRVLRISDFNTTGLTGSNEQRCSPWQDLVKSSGVSNKSGESGGSFGIGKSAPFACSNLRTVFYNTLDKDGFKAYQGVADLVSFKYPDKKKLIKTEIGEVTQGKGYYGENSTNSAVKELINIGDYKRTQTGTDVFVLGFVEHTDWINEITKAVIDGYLISILQNDLVVSIEDIELNADNIGEIIESLKDEVPLAYNYFQVLNDEETFKIEENFYDLGKLELYILIKKDFRRKVLMARSNGMKIFDKDRISAAIQFAGVCILKDRDLNTFFRKMENPQHDDWQPDRYSEVQAEVKKANKYKKDLFKFIKDKVLEVGRMTVTDEMDAVGAGEYVSDISQSEQADLSKNESISNEVKDYTQIEKISVKTNNGIQKTLGKNISTFEEDMIGDLGDYEDDAVLNKDINGDNTRNSFGGNNGENKQGSSEGKQLEGEKSVFVKPLKLRVFMFDISKNLYKLTFTPELSAKNAYVKISIAGEQSDTSVKVSNATINNETSLISRDDKIYIGNIIKDNTYSILYSINFKEICSMGVEIHGYKI